MSTLPEIIAEIKVQALASGFAFVSENKVVQSDISDTLLPAMYIKLDKIDYNKFRLNVTEETYTFSLLMVTAEKTNPISSLKTLQDAFLSKLVVSTVLKNYFLQEKVNLIDSTITNDKELNKTLGGESCILTLTIENITNF